MSISAKHSKHVSNQIVWAALVVLTIASVTFVELQRTGAGAVIFGIAVIKGQMVALNFMETRKALPVWNTLYRVWIVGIGIVLGCGALLAGHG